MMDFQKLQDLRVVSAVVGFSLLMGYVWFFMGDGEIGESCHANMDCKGRACLTVNGDSFCTLASTTCPIGSRSLTIDVSVKNKTGIRDREEAYCIPARLVKAVKKGASGRIRSKK